MKQRFIIARDITLLIYASLIERMSTVLLWTAWRLTTPSWMPLIIPATIGRIGYLFIDHAYNIEERLTCK